MFKNPGNYFLSICFDWKNILPLLDVPENEQSDFSVTDRYAYSSPNANSKDGLGINSVSAVFEYYVFPHSLRNGSYSYSTIFDQQLKRFFESPNINYGPVLKNSRHKDLSVTCLFSKNITNNKAGFSIYLSGDGVERKDWKVLVFLFDESYLNRTYALPPHTTSMR